MDVEDVGAIVDLAAVRRRRRAEPRPGVARAVHQRLAGGRRRVIAAPDEQPGQVEAVIGVQMRQQHVDRTRVGVPLQRAEHASTEVDHQWRSVRRPQQITRCRRVRADDAPGAAQHGYSHGHYCAMPKYHVGENIAAFADAESFILGRCDVTMTGSTPVIAGPRNRAARLVNASGSPVASNTRSGGRPGRPDADAAVHAR